MRFLIVFSTRWKSSGHRIQRAEGGHKNSIKMMRAGSFPVFAVIKCQSKEEKEFILSSASGNSRSRKIYEQQVEIH